MKTLVITSALTFVPENYEALICPLAENEHVGGLMLLENRSLDFAAKAIALLGSAAAPRLGLQLLRNFSPASAKRKLEAYRRQGKPAVVFKDPNSPDALEWIRSAGFDLILNARTRYIFRGPLLQAPRFGCVNIHHGLLPEQRGLMCDFWAFLASEPIGFSIHQMTEKLDDGAILEVVETTRIGNDYLATIGAGARRELEACQAVLERIASAAGLTGRPNTSAQAIYRKNPGLLDFFNFRMKGLRI